MPEICPFLAATHDLDSVLSYPSEANVCTRLGEAQPVATGHQASYCLRARYWFCPVYNGAIKQPPVPIAFEDLPPSSVATPPRPIPVPLNMAPVPTIGAPTIDPAPSSITADASTADKSPEAPPVARAPRSSRAALVRPREALIFLLILAAIGLGGGILSGRLRDQLAALNGSSGTATLSAIIAGSTLTNTPSEAVPSLAIATASPTITLTATPTPSLTNTLTATITVSPTATLTTLPTLTSTFATPAACIPPADWIAYIIQPGETYYHIAAKFNTTVDILQKVNCLADPQRVLSGQTLRVPPLIATNTPTATATTKPSP